jgi:hypothetical protein
MRAKGQAAEAENIAKDLALGTDESVQRVIDNATELLVTLNADLKAATALTASLSTSFDDVKAELDFIGAKEIDSTTAAGQNTLAKEADLNKQINWL